ncbi:hypothetical protein B0H13DRAFT_2524423 [Mycena leptocephala]|nr:hypothetical protein B0H13DRAFT_2524423 [Mycena leptocephala]
MTATLQFPAASLSILGSDLPDNSTIQLVVAAFFVGVIAFMFHYASPLCLTRVLIAAIADVEKIYLEALETGLLSPSDVDTREMLYALQITVSKTREASLRNSLSVRSTLREFIKGHTFTLLRCIREVRALETHIEVHIYFFDTTLCSLTSN